MKKMIFLIMLLVVLVGCGNKAPDNVNLEDYINSYPEELKQAIYEPSCLAQSGCLYSSIKINNPQLMGEAAEQLVNTIENLPGKYKSYNTTVIFSNNGLVANWTSTDNKTGKFIDTEHNQHDNFTIQDLKSWSSKQSSNESSPDALFNNSISTYPDDVQNAIIGSSAMDINGKLIISASVSDPKQLPAVADNICQTYRNVFSDYDLDNIMIDYSEKSEIIYSWMSYDAVSGMFIDAQKNYTEPNMTIDGLYSYSF